MPSATRTRSRTTAASPAARHRPAPGEVFIRMYGQGVGDCFLLMFPRVPGGADKRPFYVLVDCGVVGGTPGAPERMRQVVRDIKATTLDEKVRDDDNKAKGHIDLLVITHEHWDHLAGFVQAEEEWKQIQVDALWTAWTEKQDEDGLPRVLKEILAKQRMAIAEAADRALRLGLAEQHEVLLSLMGFYGDVTSEGQGFAVAKGVSDAFQIAKGLVPQERHICCEPGEVRPLMGTGAVAYVLGPPRNDDRLRQMKPTKRAPETYQEEEPGQAGPDGGPALRGTEFSLEAMSGGRSAFNAFAMPFAGRMLAAGPEADAGKDPTPEQLTQRKAFERSFPFEALLRIPLPIAEREAAEHPALASYFEPVSNWRRIDFDWLSASADFALRADALTNNTSLVLAFELPAKAEGAERGVLLFAGDAQVGNWLSWDDITAWLPKDGAVAAQKKPDIGDLLKRLVFYKVGHHGSHNATLKAKGVERMPEENLTAFVPVSATVAHKVKGWGRMPLETLLNALAERAAGRVVLPNGQIWPAQPGPASAAGHAQIGLKLADEKLPAVLKDGETIEEETPLWVEIGISY
jgi:hypothetical protein